MIPREFKYLVVVLALAVTSPAAFGQTGACCDDLTESCTTDVPQASCQGPDQRFDAGNSCSAFSPPCGMGACCLGLGGPCQIETEANCTALSGVAWLPGQACNALVCADCDGNLIADGQDIRLGTAQDCNENGVPDSCDITANPSIDCNLNGIPDSCDVQSPLMDCNDNGIVDDCEIDVNSPAPGGPFFCTSNCDPDCNENGKPDSCDIDPGDPDGNGDSSPDCNGNGKPDECEIDENSPAPGGPWFCTVDCLEDCDDDGIPDVCEIPVNCSAPGGPYFCTSGCNPDCNNNGVPDNCDIASGTSLDVNPPDGIPDECRLWTGASPTDDNWHNPANWQPQSVPNNVGATRFSVVIDFVPAAATVILNANATVDTLKLASGMTVSQTGGDLSIDSPNGVVNEGTILVADTRAIVAADSFTVTGSGTIELDGVDARIDSASAGDELSSETNIKGSGLISGEFRNTTLGSVTANDPAGRIELTGQVENNGQLKAEGGGTLKISTDVTIAGGGQSRIDGIGSNVEIGEEDEDPRIVDGDGPIIIIPGSNSLLQIENSTVGGFNQLTLGNNLAGPTQLVFANVLAGSLVQTNGPASVDQNATLTVASSLISATDWDIKDGAEVFVQPGGTLATNGMFINRQTAGGVADFIWQPGSILRMTGGNAPCQVASWTSRIEAASEDRGPALGGGGYQDNFDFSIIELLPNANVALFDSIDNGLRDGPFGADEAVYADQLVLGLNSQLHLNGLKLYVNGMQVEPGPYPGGGMIVDDGACCLATGECVEQTEACCLSSDGVFHGIGTPCTPGFCFGACCQPAGYCTETPTELACASSGGIYQGMSSTCANSHCPLGNDTCGGAAPLTIGSTVFVNTSDATTDVLGASSCSGSTALPVKGVWFSLVGNGETLTASTCHPDTFVDTVVQVYCSCGDLECVGANDDTAGVNPCFLVSGNSFRKSRVSWCSMIGQQYLIHVGTFNSTGLPRGGPVQLSVTAGGSPCGLPAGCTDVVRRCCYWSGGVQQCGDFTYGQCHAFAGLWGTAGSTCGTPCPVTIGRCCYLVGGIATCAEISNEECNTLSGLWNNGQTCAAGCPLGRCCYLFGGVTACGDMADVECRDRNGYWTGSSTCVTSCPMGRCCYLDDGASTCTDNLSEVECEYTLGGFWTEGFDCTAPCPTGRCCHLNGADDACAAGVHQGECLLTLDGSWTVGSNCATACPTARCCYNNNQSCDDMSGPACAAIGGNWISTETCSATPCPVNDTEATSQAVACGFLVNGNSLGAANDYGVALVACAGGVQAGPDVVYRITSPVSAQVSVTMTPSGFNASLYVVTDCDDINGTCVDGANAGGVGSAETASWMAVAGTTYYIICDRFGAGPGGSFTLSIGCDVLGACCHADTTCTDGVAEAGCVAPGDSFLAGATCGTTNCATGACCHGDGTCSDNVSQVACNAADDLFHGNGTTCAGSTCAGRCCYTLFGFQSECAVTNEVACAGPSLGGIFSTGQTCGTPCPTGRCCTGSSCAVTEQDVCLDNGGAWFVGENCGNPSADCAPPANDTCAAPVAVGCGNVANGTLAEAVNDYDPVVPGPSCTSFAAVGPDVVFSFSSPVTRSVTILVDPSPEFDASLYVVTDCSDMTTCVAGADDNVLSPGDETVTFVATASTTYYVICDKFGTSAGGPFTLSVTCPLDPCTSCEADMDGNGRLDGRDSQVFTDCLVSAIGGVPSLNGCGCSDVNGDEHIDMIDVADFASRLIDVNNKLCGDGLGRCCIDNGAICTDNVTLYECNDLGGTFTAGLDCATECPVLPDTCDDAQALTLGVETIGDNTIGTDEVPSVVCGVSSPNQALWYTIVGTGNTMTVSTCSPSTNFDTMVQVWCGPSCAELQCVGGNDDATPFDPACELTPGAGFTRKSRVTWCSSLGQVYYIAVGGFSTTVGQFGVTVTDDGVPCAPPVSCTPPIGRCCTNGGTTCAENTQAQCTGLGGTWTVGLNCIDNPCPITATNDTCETAEPIACGGVVSGTLTGMANHYDQVTGNVCTGYESGGPDAVFNFAPPADSVVTVDLTGIAFDGSLYVVTDCNVLVPCVGGSDACCVGAAEQVIFQATAFTTYYIIVDAFTQAPANGDFTLSVMCDFGGGGACCSSNGICTDVAGVPQCQPPGTFMPGMSCGSVPCSSCVGCLDTEGEVCGANPDTLNGGCNSVPNVFSPIACGVPVCGAVWANGGTRDTDWYEFTLASPQMVTWNVQADFPFLMQIVDAAGGCEGAIVVAGDSGVACGGVVTAGPLNAGTHWVIVAPDDFDNYPCAAGPWTYTGLLTCESIGAEGACCELGVCTDESDQATCEANGGTYMGLGTTCGGTICPGPNDTCSGATVIVALPFVSAGSTVGYSNDYDSGVIPGACPYSGSTAPDVAYLYAPPVDQTITVDLCASNYDTKVYVFENDCAGVPIAGGCNDDACGVNCGGGAYCSQIAGAAVTGGATYFIIVDGYGAAEGGYSLSVSSP